MKYAKTTLAKRLFDDEISALNALAARHGMTGFDALAACDGMSWLKDQIDSNPVMTLDEFSAAFTASGGDVGAWASAIMRDIGDNLYPELRSVFIAALHGDNCTVVAKHCRNKLSSAEKEQLRRQFTTHEEPSTDLETELR
jgi:hypothetical protein